MEELDKKELKILALREGFRNKVASITDEYEDRIAELRVELTEREAKLHRLEDENQNLKSEIDALRASQEQEPQEEA